jgi:hypothetical protein
MDAIDETLATSALSSKHSPALQAALSMGKKTLNRYYEKTDLSNTYRIAMGTSFSFTFFSFIAYRSGVPSSFFTDCSIFSVLHPRHKLSYFKIAKWEDDWIKAARQLVRAEFDLSYRHPPGFQAPAFKNEVRVTSSLFLRPATPA